MKILEKTKGDVVIEFDLETQLMGHILDGLVIGNWQGNPNVMPGGETNVFGPLRASWIGYEALWNKVNHTQYVALSDCRVEIWDVSEILNGQGPELSQILIDAGGQISELSVQQFVTRLSTRKRVISTLIDLRRRIDWPEIPLTHREFASICTMDRSNVSRVLKDLEFKGLIKLGYNVLELTQNVDDLKAAFIESA